MRPACKVFTLLTENCLGCACDDEGVADSGFGAIVPSSAICCMKNRCFHGQRFFALSVASSSSFTCRQQRPKP
jgi:hypothetical protein